MLTRASSAAWAGGRLHGRSTARLAHWRVAGRRALVARRRRVAPAAAARAAVAAIILLDTNVRRLTLC